MHIHELKTDPVPFLALLTGNKSFEVRDSSDREFKLFDHIILRETVHTGGEMRAGKPLEYTGRQLTREVQYIQDGYGLPAGLVVLGLRKI